VLLRGARRKREKGNNSGHVVIRRVSGPGAGRGRQAQGSRSKQGREELSIEVVVVESSRALSVRVLFIIIEVVSTSPLAVPAFQRSHCLFGVWMRA